MPSRVAAAGPRTRLAERGLTVPWCDDCSRFYNPNSLHADGTCPTLRPPLGDPAEVPREPAGAPWHFKLLVAATVIYLGWRFVQGLSWVAHHI